MGIWGANDARRGGDVLPVRSPDARSGRAHRTKTMQNADTSLPVARRLSPFRGRLGAFLLLNIVAIVGFIFASAWYFPSASTTGIVEEAIKQGDVSLYELPPRKDGVVDIDGDHPTESPDFPISGAKIPRASKATSEATSEEPSRDTLTREAELTTKTIDEMAREAESVDEIVQVATSMPISDHTPLYSTDQSTKRVQTASSLPLPLPSPTHVVQPTITLTTPPGQSHSMEELLRQMKGTPGPTARSTPAQTILAATVDEGIQLQRDGHAPGTLGNIPMLADDEGLGLNLVLWLDANEGVEVENKLECETLGISCELTNWKNLASHSNNAELFQPVDSHVRPVLLPSSHSGQATLSFTCGMIHPSGVILHELMTLFFVLSPSAVELGDTYASQKFFGNAPYGQFLLHGGKPAFYTAGGLVESSFVARNDEFFLVAYRLHRHSVDIKINGLEWNPKRKEKESFLVRFSKNSALSLGNVKNVCDTNAFRGRIAEVRIYNEVLSDFRVDEIEKELLRKWWGEEKPTIQQHPVTLSLPSNDNAAAEPTSTPRTDTDAETTRQAIAPDAKSPLVKRDGDTDQLPALHVRPQKFDPEGVFEWVPPADLLALIAREQGIDSSRLADRWKREVREKVDSVRNFQLGGEVLRALIRERRDELLQLREELFSG